LPYRQPRAFCRTLVYQWGGEMLFGGLEEQMIVGGLVTNEQTPEMRAKRADVERIHGSGQTVAYKSNDRRSPLNPLQSAPTHFYGYAWTAEEECDENTAREKVKIKLLAGFGGLGDLFSPSRRAFSLSLRYQYENAITVGASGQRAVDPNGRPRKSGHAVGFYGSTRRFPASRKGYRFFDPNIGIWRFNTLDEMARLFLDEWLVEFMDNTLARDPDDSPLEGKRKVQAIRFIEFQKA
jgi:hypothetical protein